MLHVLWVRDAQGVLKAVWVGMGRRSGQIIDLNDYREARNLGLSGRDVLQSLESRFIEG